MRELRLVRLQDQGGHDVALQPVEMVANPVKVCRHDRDVVTSVLAAIGLAKLDTCDLGHRVPLVGGLQRSGQQRFLRDRLGGQSRIDARGAHQEELLDTSLVAGLDDCRLDGEVIIDELGRTRAVGMDAANARSGQKDRLGADIPHPFLDLVGPAKIDQFPRRGDDLTVFSLQATHQRATDHSAMTGDPDSLIAQRVRLVAGHRQPPCSSGECDPLQPSRQRVPERSFDVSSRAWSRPCSRHPAAGRPLLA